MFDDMVKKVEGVVTGVEGVLKVLHDPTAPETEVVETNPQHDPSVVSFMRKHSAELRGVAKVLDFLLAMAPIPGAEKDAVRSIVSELYKAADNIASSMGYDIDGDGRPALNPAITNEVKGPVPVGI